MKKQSDGKVKIKCTECNKDYFYDLENDEDHCEFVKDDVYVVWCKNCGEEIAFMNK